MRHRLDTSRYEVKDGGDRSGRQSHWGCALSSERGLGRGQGPRSTQGSGRGERKLVGGAVARLNETAAVVQRNLSRNMSLRLLMRTAWLLCILAAPSNGAHSDPAIAIGTPVTERSRIPSLDRALIVIKADTRIIPLRVELATMHTERSRGLMDRGQLPANAGMLFLYAEPQSPFSGFWMFRTRIPLDIAFLSRRGVILAIKSMAPCASSNPRACPVYTAGVAYTAALEVNQGFFAAHKISRGDRVMIPETRTPPE